MSVFSLFSKGPVSGFPDTRRAREKDPRDTACSRHRAVGCTQAPLPGSTARSSTIRRPSCSTTRSNSARVARLRHATQVRTETILPASLFPVFPGRIARGEHPGETFARRARPRRFDSLRLLVGRAEPDRAGCLCSLRSPGAVAPPRNARKRCRVLSRSISRSRTGARKCLRQWPQQPGRETLSRFT